MTSRRTSTAYESARTKATAERRITIAGLIAKKRRMGSMPTGNLTSSSIGKCLYLPHWRVFRGTNVSLFALASTSRFRRTNTVDSRGGARVSTSESAARIVDDRRGCRDYADRIGQSSSVRVAKRFVLITKHFSTVSLGDETEFDEAAERSPLSGKNKAGGPNRSPRFNNLGLCRAGEQRSAHQVCHFFPRPFFAGLSIAIGAAEANVLSRLTIVVFLISGFTLPFTG